MEKDEEPARKFEIYRHTSKTSGKSYVGYTSKTTKHRWNQHLANSRSSCSSGYNGHFSKALRKYGAEDWITEILDYADTYDEALEKEMRHISLNNSFEGGYNSTIGGEGSNGSKWTDEQRKYASENAYERTPEIKSFLSRTIKSNMPKLIAARHSEEQRERDRVNNTGPNNPMYGVKLTAEQSEAKSKASVGHLNAFYGRTHSEDTKAKISRLAKERARLSPNPFEGKSHSDATRSKMAAAWVRRKENIKKEKMQNTFQDGFSQEIWESTYKDHNDTCLSDTFRRVAKDIASAETTPEKQAEWEEKFYDMLSDFKGVSGGRIMSNAGTEWKNTSYMNCFVGPLPNQDLDSINSIFKVLTDQANTLKSEGGWGMDFSFIRPRGSFIGGVGVESPGSVKFMELFDKSSEIVTAGSGKKSTNKKAKGKIRKGAMMATLSVSHPDIVEFITAKQTQGRLSKFNMSVDCSDEFMGLVSKGDKEATWNLEFPDTTYEKYKAEWNGNLRQWKANGYPVTLYDTVKVQWLWDLIMQSTYNRAEPGVLFLDRANFFNPLSYGETILSTNP